jgi:hypothetical protein
VRLVQQRSWSCLGPCARRRCHGVGPVKYFMCFLHLYALCLIRYVSSLQSRQLQGEWQRTVGSRGDQPGQFNQPRGLAGLATPDEAFLLVADNGNHRVTVLRATDGTWVRQLTGPPGTLLDPCYVAVVPSTGEVLVSDVGHHQVVRFRSIDDDTVFGTLGTGQGSGPTQFNIPYGIAVLDGCHRPLVCYFLFYFCRNHTPRHTHLVFFTRDGPCRTVQ